MAKEGNLRKINSEEAREMGKKGGKASVKARKERKALREELLLLLSKGDTQERVSLAQIKQALDGNTKAFEVIRDTIGEKPVDKIEQEAMYTIKVDIVDE